MKCKKCKFKRSYVPTGGLFDFERSVCSNKNHTSATDRVFMPRCEELVDSCGLFEEKSFLTKTKELLFGGQNLEMVLITAVFLFFACYFFWYLI